MTGPECDALTKEQVKDITVQLRDMARDAKLLGGHMEVVEKTIRKMNTLLDSYLDACAAVDRLMDAATNEGKG